MKKLFTSVTVIALLLTITACDSTETREIENTDISTNVQEIATTEETTAVSPVNVETEEVIENIENADEEEIDDIEVIENASYYVIPFPAYELENPDNLPHYDEINNAQHFILEAMFPENWSLKSEKGDENVPSGELFTPVYIYDGDTLIGYIGFNVFEPYNEEIEPEEYYMTVYPGLRLSSMFRWDPYTAVKTSENAETGIADIEYLDPAEIDNHPGAMADVPTLKTVGILSYDKALQVYIGIAFMPEIVDKELATAIAQTINLKAVEDK